MGFPTDDSSWLLSFQIQLRAAGAGAFPGAFFTQGQSRYRTATLGNSCIVVVTLLW